MKDDKKELPNEEFLMELNFVERGEDDGSLQLTTRTFPRQADAVTSSTVEWTSERTLCIRAPHWRGRPRRVALHGNMKDKARGEALHRSWNISTRRRGKPSQFNTPINFGGDSLIVVLDEVKFEVESKCLPWVPRRVDFRKDDTEDRKKLANGKDFAKKSRKFSGLSRSEVQTQTKTQRMADDHAPTKSTKQIPPIDVFFPDKNALAANIPNVISCSKLKNGSPGTWSELLCALNNGEVFYTSKGQESSMTDPDRKCMMCGEGEVNFVPIEQSKTLLAVCKNRCEIVSKNGDEITKIKTFSVNEIFRE